ncbi:MAG: hypothetical protein K9I71_04360 [Ignavibacteriales bacterium]|nr:hypothetical protein [Ignavibacteriales bacterium]MCF8315331.1 hypothetical protein [Ignavibacteriales bacterium]MCF8436777.1 hypothetical protein [Ignavibacteriales bacterium]
MTEKMTAVFSELSEESGLPVDVLVKLAERGCMIAFKDDMNSRIKAFGGEDCFTGDALEDFIMTLIYGGTISFAVENSSD